MLAGLLAKPKLIFGGLAILAVLAYVGVLKFQIWSLEDDVVSLNQQVDQLKLDVAHEKNEVAKCQIVVDKSNDQILNLKDASDHRQEVLDMLGENIKIVRKLTNGKISDIENAITPENCEKAMQFLRDGVSK